MNSLGRGGVPRGDEAYKLGDVVFESTERFCRNFHLKPFEVCSPTVTHDEKRRGKAMTVSFKGAHCPQAIIPRSIGGASRTVPR
jgi:hypothetical protein